MADIHVTIGVNVGENFMMTFGQSSSGGNPSFHADVISDMIDELRKQLLQHVESEFGVHPLDGSMVR